MRARRRICRTPSVRRSPRRFECSDEGKVRRGSLELFKVAGGVRTQVTLGDETHGTELRWLELFERKLREERGTPVPVAPPATALPRPARDGGV